MNVNRMMITIRKQLAGLETQGDYTDKQQDALGKALNIMRSTEFEDRFDALNKELYALIKPHRMAMAQYIDYGVMRGEIDEELEIELFFVMKRAELLY